MTNSRPDPLSADWITIWYSEQAALAVDREVHETGQRIAAAWAAASMMLMSLAASNASGRARPEPPPGPAAAADAPDAGPDPRDAAIAALMARVDELERRLAGLAAP